MKNCIRALLLLAMLSSMPNSAVFADDAPPALSEWRSNIAALLPMGELTQRLRDPSDPQLRQELYRLMYSQIAQGYFALVYVDPQHPDFWPGFNQAFNLFAPNPDNAYYTSPIDDDGVYKISGFRGSVRVVGFNLGSGMKFKRATGVLGPTLADYDIDEMHVNKKDGSFEFVLSPERPKAYTGDWRKLLPGTTSILIRQISYDWAHEVDGRFAIERLDRAAIKPRASAEKIADDLKLIAQWAEGWTAMELGWTQGMRDKGLTNKVIVTDITSVGGLSTQKYIQGLFDLAADEALILETEVPKQCLYWNIQLNDELLSMIDPLNRQTTLNGYSARLDRDGKFRVVISAQDPGVPNWLDNAGLGKGGIWGRWNKCSSYPTPAITKVKVADVRKYLPADTPVVTAEARDAAIRARRKAAQLRRRW